MDLGGVRHALPLPLKLKVTLGKIPWRRAWQPTPVFSPGESHGQRNLAGYSPWGCKGSDTTEATKHSIAQGSKRDSREPLYFNKLSFIRLLTIINHHKIEQEFQNCTGHKALG